METVRHPISSGLFNKDADYVRGIEAAVEELYEREFTEQCHTPQYALRLKQDYPEPCKESLLFKTQLLAPNRSPPSQMVIVRTSHGSYELHVPGYPSQIINFLYKLEQQDGGARRAKSAFEKTRRQNPAIPPGSFYRPTSAHPYLQQQQQQQHKQQLEQQQQQQQHQVVDLECDDSYKYGRPTRASILRNQNRIQSAPVTIQEERRQDRLRAERLERKRCISANQVQRELAERKSGRVTGETFHAFLVGARYNSSNYIDRRAIDRYGMYLPRSNPAECFGRPDRLLSSQDSHFGGGGGGGGGGSVSAAVGGCQPSFASGVGGVNGGVTSEENERLASVLSMFSGEDCGGAGDVTGDADGEAESARRLVYSVASEQAADVAEEDAGNNGEPPPPPPSSAGDEFHQRRSRAGTARSAPSPSPSALGVVGRSFQQGLGSPAAQAAVQQQQQQQRRQLLQQQQLQDRRRTSPSIPRGGASMPAVLGRALQQSPHLQAAGPAGRQHPTLAPAGTPRRVMPIMPGTYPVHLLANQPQPHQHYALPIQQQQQQQRSVSFNPIPMSPQSPRQAMLTTQPQHQQVPFRVGDSDIERMFAYVENAIVERNSSGVAAGKRGYSQGRRNQQQQQQPLLIVQAPSNTPRDSRRVADEQFQQLHLEELAEVEEVEEAPATGDDADDKLRISVSLQTPAESADESA